MNEFSAIAPEEWAKQFRQGGFTMALVEVPVPARRRPPRRRGRRRRRVRPRRVPGAVRPEPRPPEGHHGFDRRPRPGAGRDDAAAGAHPHGDRARRRGAGGTDRLVAHPLGDPPGARPCRARQSGRHRAAAGAGRGHPRPAWQGRAAGDRADQHARQRRAGRAGPSRSTRCRPHSSTSPTSRSTCCAAACRTSSSRWPAATGR